MNRIHPATLIGLLVMFLFAAAITVAAYFSLIAPEDRHNAFHAGLVASCFAELVFFGYLLYVIGVRPSPDQPDVANRLRLMVLITLSALAILVTSGIAAAPGNADKFISNQMVVLQLVATFIIFVAVFFQHRQSVVVQMRDAVPQAERRRLESYAGGMDNLLADLRSLAARSPDRVVEIEALSRRVDTLRTQLSGAGAVMPRDGRPVSPADDQLIQQRLGVVHDAVAAAISADSRQMADALARAREAVDQVLSALRQRENALTF